jgi:hypothetical protein
MAHPWYETKTTLDLFQKNYYKRGKIIIAVGERAIAVESPMTVEEWLLQWRRGCCTGGGSYGGGGKLPLPHEICEHLQSRQEMGLL